jgi:hypothetical protein
VLTVLSLDKLWQMMHFLTSSEMAGSLGVDSDTDSILENIVGVDI